MNKSSVLSEFRARFDERSLIETCSGEGCVESDVIEKTENSLKFVAQIVPISIRTQMVYMPVLFEGRGVKWTNPKGAKQLKVSVHGKRLQILTGRCGRPRNLVGVLFG